MPGYTYTVSGTAAENQTWETSGRIQTDLEGGFPNMVQEAMRESFMQLTQGKAVFGNPGIGCRGPYKITKLLVERDL